MWWLVLVCIHYFLLSVPWSYPFNISVIFPHLIPSHPSWKVTLPMAILFNFYILNISISIGLHLFSIVAAFKVSKSFPWVSFFSTPFSLKGYLHFWLSLHFLLLIQENLIASLAQPPLNLRYITVWLLFLFFGHLYLNIFSGSTFLNSNTRFTDVLCLSLLLFLVHLLSYLFLTLLRQPALSHPFDLIFCVSFGSVLCFPCLQPPVFSVIDDCIVLLTGHQAFCQWFSTVELKLTFHTATFTLISLA